MPDQQNPFRGLTPPAPSGPRRPLPRTGPPETRTQKALGWLVDSILGATGVRDPLAEGATPATGVGALAAMLSPMAVMGGLKRIANPIKAYHGSPHDFDRFDLSKIGTGEGAQAYGHGLYFADKPDVARAYQETLSRRLDTPEFWEANKDRVPEFLSRPEQDELFELRQRLQASTRTYLGGPTLSDAEAARFRLLNDKYRRYYEEVDALKPKGRMYEVNIHARPEELLDWDAPLAQQPAALQELLASGRAQREIAALGRSKPATGQDALFAVDTHVRTPTPLTAGITKSDGRTGEALRQRGIPGLRYLDGLSRRAGEGSRNYVIWDDSIIEILRKYGILPPLATAAAQQATPKPVASHPQR